MMPDCIIGVDRGPKLLLADNAEPVPFRIMLLDANSARRKFAFARGNGRVQ